MSHSSTIAMIDAYLIDSQPTQFLSSFFKSTKKSFHNQEFVSVDVIRNSRTIATVVSDLSAPANNNEASKFTNRLVKPPILKEKGVINAFNQQSRRPGYNPYEDPEAGLKALEESFSIYSMLEGKLRRTQEQQVAQIFSTGKLTMNDEKGNAAYDLDFLAKVEQMATVGTTWAVDGSTGSPLADISALAAKVRTNGQINPNVLVFGNSAWARFSSNALVKSQLDNRNMMIGSIAPEDRGEGATFQGRIWIGQYQFEAWTYDAFYQDPITGAEVPFINTEHMLMISEKARLDMTFGGIPRIAEMDPRFTHFIPERISSVSRNLDLNPYAYVSPDGASLSIEVGTRPLPVPTAIDSFARLKVTA